MSKGGGKKLLKREEIPERYRWCLEEIYEDDSRWEEDFKKVKSRLEGMAKYRGRLSETSCLLLDCLKTRDTISQMMDRLYVYAHMRRDEDNGNPKYQALADRAEGLSNEARKEFSFITPEILQIHDGKMKVFMAENESLRLYEHHISEITRLKDHILSPEQERVISMAGEMAQTPENIYRMLSHADIKFPAVKDEAGEEVELSEGRYYQLIRSGDRKVRENAFKELYSTYRKYGNTFSAMINGTVKRDIFNSRVREYNSSLEAALHNDNIPVRVYDNIIGTIGGSLEPLHRYVSLRKKILGVDKVHMYDLYTPLVRDANIRVSYEEALEMVERGLKPLGPEYNKFLVRGYISRWIDVYENLGKTNGAYSWGSYDTHP
jgi:oligoendopeptidase F